MISCINQTSEVKKKCHCITVPFGSCSMDCCLTRYCGGTDGYVVRSKHFLLERDSHVTFRTVSRCKIYSLKLEVLVLLSLMYIELNEALAVTITQERNDKKWNKGHLDFIDPVEKNTLKNAKI